MYLLPVFPPRSFRSFVNVSPDHPARHPLPDNLHHDARTGFVAALGAANRCAVRGRPGVPSAAPVRGGPMDDRPEHEIGRRHLPARQSRPARSLQTGKCSRRRSHCARCEINVGIFRHPTEQQRTCARFCCVSTRASHRRLMTRRYLYSTTLFFVGGCMRSNRSAIFPPQINIKPHRVYGRLREKKPGLNQKQIIFDMTAM